MKTFMPLTAIMPLALCMVIMGACFSPWDGSGDQGSIVIDLANGGARYTAGVGPGGETEGEETAAVEYTIILTSPGKESITRKLTDDTTAVFSVQPGLWNVAVRRNSAGELNSYGETDVEVQAGRPVDALISMITPTPFRDWDDLERNITGSNGKDQVFMIPHNLTVTNSIEIGSGRNITLLAKDKITITKGDVVANSLFRVIWGSKLTLGGIDGGEIIIEGNSADNNSSLFYVGTTGLNNVSRAGGILIINDGVTLTNNHATINDRGGAVVMQGGTFIMKGGIISRNSSVSGGGVRVLSGTFTKTGGTIYGSNGGDNSNKATSGNGNAVYFDSSHTSWNTTLGPDDKI